MRLVLPVPPSANQYWKTTREGRIYVSTEAKDYKTEVGWLCVNVEPLKGRVIVSIWVYRAKRRGDLDNFQKILLDALQGYAFDNDSQIVELHSYLEDDPRNPRVEVEVNSVPSLMLPLFGS